MLKNCLKPETKRIAIVSEIAGLAKISESKKKKDYSNNDNGESKTYLILMARGLRLLIVKK